MEIVWLKFLKKWNKYESGDVVKMRFSKYVNKLIKNKIAERYIPDNKNASMG
jgi:hypothetical protein